MKLILKEKKLAEESVDNPTEERKLENLLFQLYVLLSKTVPVEVAVNLFKQYSTRDTARIKSKEKNGNVTLLDVMTVFNFKRTYHKLPESPLDLNAENIKET